MVLVIGDVAEGVDMGEETEEDMVADVEAAEAAIEETEAANGGYTWPELTTVTAFFYSLSTEAYAMRLIKIDVDKLVLLRVFSFTSN